MSPKIVKGYRNEPVDRRRRGATSRRGTAAANGSVDGSGGKGQPSNTCSLQLCLGMRQGSTPATPLICKPVTKNNGSVNWDVLVDNVFKEFIDSLKKAKKSTPPPPGGCTTISPPPPSVKTADSDEVCSRQLITTTTKNYNGADVKDNHKTDTLKDP